MRSSIGARLSALLAPFGLGISGLPPDLSSGVPRPEYRPPTGPARIYPDSDSRQSVRARFRESNFHRFADGKMPRLKGEPRKGRRKLARAYATADWRKYQEEAAGRVA